MASKTLTTLSAIALTPIFFAGCSSSNNSDSTNQDASGFTINAKGGSGGSKGGRGGGSDAKLKFPPGLFLSKNYGSGNIEILKTGLATDGLVVPQEPVSDLGDIPLEVTSDMTITAFESEPAAGIAYSNNGSLNTIYISNGDGILANEAPVSGISIASGITLTLAPLGLDATLNLENDIQNNGVITSTFVEGTYRNISLSVYRYFGGVESSITTQGTSSANIPGTLAITSTLAIYNQGTLNASGFDTTTGTNAANISLTAIDDGIYNSGDITSRGGNALSTAGNGGAVSLVSDVEIINSGNINLQGGDSEINSAGRGGRLTLSSGGKQIINSGNLTLSGGNTDGAESNGGSGGFIDIVLSRDTIPATPAGDIKVSGGIDVSGGNARATGANDGGIAGTINIVMANVEPAANESIQLLGYSLIDLDGGEANFPGKASSLSINMNRTYALEVSLDTATHGNIINQANISAKGGNVAEASSNAAVAGSGGNIVMRTAGGSGLTGDKLLEKVINSGRIDISAGSNSNQLYNPELLKKIAIGSLPGFSGKLTFTAANNVENTGSIIANGASNVSISGEGFGSYGVEFISFLAAVNNSANITANGGNGTMKGGTTAGISFTGVSINNSGALSASGGNADELLTGSTGGRGGEINLLSSGEAGGATHTGTVNHAPGTGETQGIDGAFIIDGDLISGVNPPEIIKARPVF